MPQHAELSLQAQKRLLQKEQLQRELCRHDYHAFVSRLSSRFRGGFKDGWHIHEIAKIAHQIKHALDHPEDRTVPRIYIVTMPPRHMKALADDTWIPTPDRGLVRMGNLKPGDTVFAGDGSPTKVLDVAHFQNRQMYRVVTDDGAEVLADEDHLWTVRLCRKRKTWTVRNTKYLAERASDRSPRLPEHGAIVMEDRDLPVAPYTLGLWLGDGTSRNNSITSAPEDMAFIRERIEDDGYQVLRHNSAFGWTVSGLRKGLVQLGLLRNKHIPEEYFSASLEQRMSLLRGLVDSDGTITPTGQVLFQLKSKVLADGLRRLVHTLGRKAAIHRRTRVINDSPYTYYEVSFYLQSCAFLPRKAERTRDTEHRSRYLRSIEKTDIRSDATCIAVAHPSKTFLCTEHCIVTHNSENFARCLPLWLLGHDPHMEVIVGTCEGTLAKEHGDWIKNTATQEPLFKGIFPDLGIRPDSKAKDRLITNKGGGVRSVGRGGGAVGRGADLFIIDDPYKNDKEADSEAIQKEVWEWYINVADSRLSPTGVTVIMHTRWRCLLPSSKVYALRKGEQKISLVRIDTLTTDDRVLTTKGPQSVEAVQKTEHEGELYRIRAVGDCEPLSCTPDHRIWTERGWIEAQDLKLTDRVLFPKLPSSDTLPAWPQLMKPAAQLGRSRSKWIDRRDELAAALATGKSYDTLAPRFGLKNKSAFSAALRSAGLNRDVRNAFTGNPVGDPEFWWVAGRWVADGWLASSRARSTKGRVGWAIGYEKEEQADRIVSFLNRYGIACSKEQKKNSGYASDRDWSVFELRASSAQLAEFYRTHFGAMAAAKGMSEEVLNLPKSLAVSLLQGWFDGDGCCCSGGEGARVSSISRNLLRAGRALAVRCGFHASLPAWNELRLARLKRDGWGIEATEEGQWCRIRSIERVPYSGPVYDITTPCHNFIADGMLVHNCDDLIGKVLKMHKEAAEDPDEEDDLGTVCHIDFPLIATRDEYSPFTNKLLRRKGEALHPARFDAAWANRKRIKMLRGGDAGARTWNAIYQQNPVVEEGNFFKEKFFQWYNPSDLPDDLYYYLPTDYAVTDDETNDPTALFPFGVDRHKNIWFLPRFYHDWKRTSETIPATLDIAADLDVMGILIEKGVILQSIEPQMRDEMDHRKKWFHIEPIPLGRNDKKMRAKTIRDLIEQGRVFFPDTTRFRDLAVPELKMFPNGEHDDIVDNLSLTGNAIAWLDGPGGPAEEERDDDEPRDGFTPSGLKIPIKQTGGRFDLRHPERWGAG